jgi:hypothetical protein
MHQEKPQRFEAGILWATKEELFRPSLSGCNDCLREPVIAHPLCHHLFDNIRHIGRPPNPEPTPVSGAEAIETRRTNDFLILLAFWNPKEHTTACPHVPGSADNTISEQPLEALFTRSLVRSCKLLGCWCDKNDLSGYAASRTSTQHDPNIEAGFVALGNNCLGLLVRRSVRSLALSINF